MKDIFALLHERSSANSFDQTHILTDEVIQALAAYAVCAPSAYHFQNWRFIAVRSPDAKTRLCNASFRQAKIEQASVTYIVCGRLNAHRTLPNRLRDVVDAGQLSREIARAWCEQAVAAHEGNVALQRDEAMRSGALAAMALMLAAQGMGLVSCPMVGFDAPLLRDDFGLDEDDVPVMLVAVGRPAGPPQKPKPRLPIASLLTVI